MNDTIILNNYINKLYNIYYIIDNINNITYKNKYWILYRIDNRIRYIEKELGTIKETPKLNINKIFKDNFKNIKLEDWNVTNRNS